MSERTASSVDGWAPYQGSPTAARSVDSSLPRLRGYPVVKGFQLRGRGVGTDPSQVTEAPYEVAWTSATKRALTRLPEKVGTAVVEFCYGALAENPQRVGKALKLDLAGLHSARRGDFRVIYRIHVAQRRVEVIAIDHRSGIYRAR